MAGSDGRFVGGDDVHMLGDSRPRLLVGDRRQKLTHDLGDSSLFCCFTLGLEGGDFFLEERVGGAMVEESLSKA